ncbi:hypothetical protein CW304_00730 [Bacillus sp. UFRGS-B20]|nr:hypothetical protein CW304_00730 [Bacillus sp. UFRGS-B20]
MHGELQFDNLGLAYKKANYDAPLNYFSSITLLENIISSIKACFFGEFFVIFQSYTTQTKAFSLALYLFRKLYVLKLCTFAFLSIIQLHLTC